MIYEQFTIELNYVRSIRKIYSRFLERFHCRTKMILLINIYFNNKKKKKINVMLRVSIDRLYHYGRLIFFNISGIVL